MEIHINLNISDLTPEFTQITWVIYTTHGYFGNYLPTRLQKTATYPPTFFAKIPGPVSDLKHLFSSSIEQIKINLPKCHFHKIDEKHEILTISKN